MQKIRFTKQAGTAVAKLSKIRTLRKNVAKVLTVLTQQRKHTVLSNLLTRKTTTKAQDGTINTVERTVKNIRLSQLPKDVRPRRTRALRRALTKSQQTRLTLRDLKRKLNYPRRTFAVPL